MPDNNGMLIFYHVNNQYLNSFVKIYSIKNDGNHMDGCKCTKHRRCKTPRALNVPCVRKGGKLILTDTIKYQ